MSRPMPHVPGVSHSMVQAGSVRLHVAEAGSGEPLVLLHGWPEHWYMWREQIKPLARHRRVICPDMRGFGWSDAPASGYRKETLATDLLALLDALEIERCGLVGHDWGGFVCFLAALREPTRFERLLALCIPPPFVSPGGRSMLAALRFWYQAVLAAPFLGTLVASRALPALGARRVGMAGSPRGTWSVEEAEIFLGQMRARPRARATQLLYRNFLLRESGELLAGRYRKLRLEVPTVLLLAENDSAVSPAHVTGAERYCDDLVVERIDGVGHFLVDERPELVTERALELFAA